jgi:hypothetical protein
VALILSVVYLGYVVALVGCLRLAKPHSWWARHRYDRHQIAAARVRYPDAPEEADETLAPLGFAWLILWVGLVSLYAAGVLPDG